MGVEANPQNINDLQATQPAITDNRFEGAQHIRNIKTVLRNVFGSFTGKLTFGSDRANNVMSLFNDQGQLSSSIVSSGQAPWSTAKDKYSTSILLNGAYSPLQAALTHHEIVGSTTEMLLTVTGVNAKTFFGFRETGEIYSNGTLMATQPWAEGRYLRVGGQVTTGAYQATAWTSMALYGNTSPGALAWGGMMSGVIQGRGTSGDNGPVSTSIYPIEIVGTASGTRLQTSGYNSRMDFDFYTTGPNAGRMVSNGQVAAWLSEVNNMGNTKVNRSGDTITGGLNVNGGVYFGQALTVNGGVYFGQALNVGGVIASGSSMRSASHAGSDASGQARWGGYFSSSIAGSAANVDIYTFETVGIDNGLDIQVNFGSQRADFKLHQNGNIDTPLGTVAFKGDLPIDPSQKIVFFGLGQTAHGARINFNSGFSSYPQVFATAIQGGGGAAQPVNPAYVDSGGFTLNVWNGSTVPALAVIAIGAK